MRSIGLLVGWLAVVALPPSLPAGEACGSCTGAGGCELNCRGTWHEERKKQTDYELRCEHACARGRDPWHAPAPECRTEPACGRVYVKKRLFKSERDGPLERVPRYEVELVPAAACGCAACRGPRAASWDPLGILAFFHLP